MERLTSPFRLRKKWGKLQQNRDQQSALLVLQNYMKARNLAKKLDAETTPTSGYKNRVLNPAESLKRLLPRRRTSKVMRAPVIINGILIRNKQGELLNPPSSTPLPCLKPIRRKSMSSRIPQSPCTLKPGQHERQWDVSAEERGDDVRIVETRNLTVELSSCDYSKDSDTFYLKDTLKNTGIEKIVEGAEEEETTTQPMPTMDTQTTSSSQDKTLLYVPADMSLCYMSMVSKASQLSMREQPSAMINMSGAVILHSTLNYPLHSTFMSDHIQPLTPTSSSDSDCDSSTMSFNVDDKSCDVPKQPATQLHSNYGVCKRLRRQTGQCQLQQHHHRLPQAISQSDLLHERTLVNDSLNTTRGSAADPMDVTLLNTSPNATCGTMITPSLVHHTDSSHSTLMSTGGLHHANKSSDSSAWRNFSHHSKKSCQPLVHHSSNQHPCISSQQSHLHTLTSSSSSLNLSHGRKKQLVRRLQQFNRSINSHRRNLEITMLGVF